jgi:HK97 family phage portal protein
MFERLKTWLRGTDKSEPDADPRTGGGWNILSGSLARTSAGEIWDKKLNLSAQNLEALNAQQSAVWACVRKICLAAMEAPICTGVDKPDGWTDLPDHPARALLRAPNATMGYALFLYNYVMHLQLTGETLLWKWRNNAGYVNELWPLPTSWVQPVADRDGHLAGYTVFQGSGREPKQVALTEMIRIWYPDPSAPMLALGPLQAVLRDVRVDESRQDYQMELLANNTRPGLILYQPDEWGSEQKDEIRDVFTRVLGAGGRGKTLFMQGEGCKVEPIPPIAELDWPGLTGLSETRICSAFGVPPIVAGLRAGLENATYSNYEQSLRAFFECTMVPLWQLLDGEMTRGLLTSEGETDGTEIYHDTENIKALKEDADKRSARATQLFSAGIIMRNEAREMAGLESLDNGGDVFVLPMNLIETPADQLGKPQEQPPKDNGTFGANAQTDTGGNQDGNANGGRE